MEIALCQSHERVPLYDQLVQVLLQLNGMPPYPDMMIFVTGEENTKTKSDNTRSNKNTYRTGISFFLPALHGIH